MNRTALWLALTALAACGPGGDETSDTDPPIDTDSGCVTDFDEDGYCAEVDDCDDANSSVHPGAVEIPYNGRDDDCDGEDLVDYDQDGFVGEQAGGDDCNDSNPNVYPDAPEECYVAIDMNCDGHIPTDDCDNDGFGRTNDCDDENPDAYPGAPEVWYDGVDSDCGYDSDFDRDGDKDEIPWADGWPPAEWPEYIIVWNQDEPDKFKYIAKTEAEAYWSGLDCNDDDALVGGNLKERWDGVDRNCDDVIDHLHERDAAQTWLANGGVVDVALGSDVALTSDYDGDGLPEIAFADVGAAEYQGRVYLIPSAAEGGKAFEKAMAEFGDPDGLGQVTGFDVEPLGDLDGDGLEELAVTNLFFDGQGAALVYDGDTIANATGVLVPSDAMAQLRGGTEEFLIGGAILNLGDISGDGLNDVLAHNGYPSAYWGVGTTTIMLFGGDGIVDGGVQRADVYIDNASNFATGLGGGLDATGDGSNDAVFAMFGGSADETTGALSCAAGAGATVHLVDGATLAASEDTVTGDWPTLTGAPCAGATLGMMDDITDDGYAEILIADPGAAATDTIENGGIVYVIDGGDWAEGREIEDLAFATIQAEKGSSWLRVENRQGDHDGDGIEDLAVGAPGLYDALHTKLELIPVSNEGSLYLFNGTDIAVGGAFVTSDADARFWHRTTGTGFGAAWEAGDLDGDGLDDLAIGAPLQGAGGGFTYYSFLGGE